MIGSTLQHSRYVIVVMVKFHRGASANNGATLSSLYYIAQNKPAAQAASAGCKCRRFPKQMNQVAKSTYSAKLP